MANTPPRDEPFEVRDTGTRKGLGCFATRDIEPGEIVLVDETPIYWNDDIVKDEKVDRWLNMYRHLNRDLRHAWASLTHSNKLELRSKYEASLRRQRPDGSYLTDRERERFAHLFMIVECNCFASIGTMAALYFKAARFNHSCDPNVWYENNMPSCWIGRAMRHIAKGEEMCISYINVHKSTLSRQFAIRRKWGFNCDCPKCVGGVDSYTASLEAALDAVKNVEADRTKPVPTFDVNAGVTKSARQVRKRAELLMEIVSIQPVSESTSRRKELVFALWEGCIFHRRYFQHLISDAEGRNRLEAAYHLEQDRDYILTAWDVAVTIWNRPHSSKWPLPLSMPLATSLELVSMLRSIRKDVRAVRRAYSSHGFESNPGEPQEENEHGNQ
ncbi:hypothetical protein GGS21DRAFT_493347 [Xylaria nigripes]|nr:hypothetical protein GGS21DRAFT_493347 [Xylaria nigripes]